MDGSPSALREAPPAAPRHWCRFHTANFTYIVLSSSSFVDQLLSANAIGASVRRGEFKELPYSGHAIEKEGKSAKNSVFGAESISPLQLQNVAQNANFGPQSHLKMKLNPRRILFRLMVITQGSDLIKNLTSVHENGGGWKFHHFSFFFIFLI